ncbi:MAG TPA: hypothetical protein VFZ67_00510 [Nitrososphaera sp.]
MEGVELLFSRANMMNFKNSPRNLAELLKDRSRYGNPNDELKKTLAKFGSKNYHFLLVFAR